MWEYMYCLGSTSCLIWNTDCLPNNDEVLVLVRRQGPHHKTLVGAIVRYVYFIGTNKSQFIFRNTLNGRRQ